MRIHPVVTALFSLLVTSVISGAPAFAAKASASGWDIRNTGQPYKDIEFTVDEGTWMSLDVSPDGKTIVFDLLNDIYSIPATGGDATLIAGGPETQRAPIFSPDGKKLLYIDDASGADNLWISNADGSSPRQITHETVDVVAGPAWDARGDAVAAAWIQSSFQKMHSSQIRLYDLKGGSGRVIVDAPVNGRDVEEATFSRDGRYVYYSERLNPAEIYLDGNHINFAVKRRDLATGKVEELASGFGSATSPQVSPDGNKVAFIRRVGAKTVLFVLNLKTGEQTPVYDNLDRDEQADFVPQSLYYPRYAWFPDGHHIAIWGKGKLFNIDVDSGKAVNIPFHVTVHQRVTTPVRVKTELAPASVEVRTVRQMAPFSDGKTLIFTALGHLWKKVGVDGKPERLTQAMNDEFEPALSRDGKKLVYVEWNDDSGSALKVASADGRGARTIAVSRGVIREPAFSPDAKEVVYRIEDPNKSMGGYRARPGIYRVGTENDKPHFVTEGDEAPMFSPDGKRIYFGVFNYTGGSVSSELYSVTRDGFDRHEHARTPDADTSGLRLSPDLKWLAFRDRQQFYVEPYFETGGLITVSAKNTEVPMGKLTDKGGYALTWSPDSSALYWNLGPILYKASPAEHQSADTPLVQPYGEIGLTVPADVPKGSIAFTHARIITMKGDQVIENGTLVVTGNRIVAVGNAADITPPAGAKVIDAKGKTIMPGLIEMHGHVDCCYGSGSMPQQEPNRYAELAFGVTTVFDPYSTEQPNYESAERTKAGLMVGPRWLGSGSVIYGRSGKADFVYVPINSYADAQAVMARKKAMGGVYIKSYKQPTREERQMLIKAGREAGIMIDVEGESHFFNDISFALDGHTNLEHNLPVANYYDDIVKFYALAGVHTTPVLNVVFGELFGENYMYQHTRSWEDPKVKRYVHKVISYYSPLLVGGGAPPYVRAMTSIHAAPEIYDIGVLSVSRSIKKLDDAGVVINVGSHGEFPGLGMDWEMQLLHEGGMSNAHILRDATLNGAKTLGFDYELGSLEVGKLADVIVLDKNPLDDIKNTNSVHYTMVNGRLYDSMTMNEIGNYNRPRETFYWELQNTNGIDWNETEAGR